MLELLTVAALNGFIYAMMLFLLASGLTLIFSMMGVLNVAHASFYMLGAFIGYQVSSVLGFWIGVLVAPLAVGALGAVVERWGLRSIHQHGHVAELLFTFGVALVIDESVQMIWGKLPVDYRSPAALDASAFTLFATSFPAYKLVMLAISVSVFSLLLVVLLRSRIGLVVQAALAKPAMVSMLGHNLPRVFMSVFGIGTALAALAGAILGPTLVTQAGMAATVAPLLWVVIVVGGLGSLSGTFVASLLIGMIQTFAVSFDVPIGALLHSTGRSSSGIGILSDLQNLTLAQIAPLLPYLLMIGFLAVKPSGLFGRRS